MSDTHTRGDIVTDRVRATYTTDDSADHELEVTVLASDGANLNDGTDNHHDYRNDEAYPVVSQKLLIHLQVEPSLCTYEIPT